MKKSELRKYISEALTPDEASKVESKYKETYAAMIRGKGPLKLKKYDNPDKVVLGRVINNLKESTRRTNEKLDIAIKEVFSEKQRKYMCVMAQPGAKRPKGLSKADAKEMCADTKISKKMNEGDLDIGHQDDEPRMIKKDIYNMGKYAMELYKKLDQYDDMDSEVDFPHWWQSKLTKAKSMLQSAYDYLDGEEKITQIDAIMEEDELTKSEKNKLKKVSSQLKKSVKAHDKQSKIIDKAISEDARQAEKWTKMDPKERKKLYPKFHNRKYSQLRSHEKAQIKETGLRNSEKNMDDYKKLNELVKAALMGPISEKKKDHNKDGKIDSEDYLIARDKAIKKAKGEKVDENLPKNTSIDNAKELKLDKTTEGIRGVIAKMSDAYMALGKELQSNTNPKIGRYMNAMAGEIKDLKRMLKGMTLSEDLDEVELPKNIKTLANQEVKDAPSMAKAMLDFYNQIKEKETLDFSQNPMMKVALDRLQGLAAKAKTNESFDSLVKKVDKAKGYTKKEAEKVAGAIAAKKMKGAGKGPTAKQKKRMAETILKELRGNINEQDYKFQDANDERVKLLRPLLKSIALQSANAIEKMARSGKLKKINDQEGAIGNSDLSLALGVEVLAALQDKI